MDEIAREPMMDAPQDRERSLRGGRRKEPDCPPDGESFDPSTEVDAADVPADLSTDAPADSRELGCSSVRASEAGEPVAATPVTDVREVSRLLLAVLLACSDSLTVLRLAQVLNSTPSLVEEGLGVLQETLISSGLPLEVSRAGKVVRLLTAPSAYPYLERLRTLRKADRLSPAALETLAVVAYRQPVIRGEIEAIRGVKAGPVLRNLLEHKLLRIAGRADVPGRPLQYGTTDRFLERFGLSSLKDLPSAGEVRALGG